jgi:hypothetical protein
VRHHAYIVTTVTIVTAQYNDVTADLIARRVLMREIESHSTDKDAVRIKNIKKQGSASECYLRPTRFDRYHAAASQPAHTDTRWHSFHRR